jgi:hypothetical protein
MCRKSLCDKIDPVIRSAVAAAPGSAAPFIHEAVPLISPTERLFACSTSASTFGNIGRKSFAPVFVATDTTNKPRAARPQEAKASISTQKHTSDPKATGLLQLPKLQTLKDQSWGQLWMPGWRGSGEDRSIDESAGTSQQKFFMAQLWCIRVI